MSHIGTFKIGDTVHYSANFHDDNNTTVDPGSPAARLQDESGNFVNLVAPAKLDGKTGWYGGTINTFGYDAGCYQIRLSGTVSAHEVAIVLTFRLITRTNADVYTRVPSAAIADYRANVAALAVESNVEGHVSTALTTYDPPTRTEATSDKEAIIAEVDANEVKIDVIQAKTDNLPSDPADQSEVEGAISASESNIRGADSDTLETLSDQLDTVPSVASIADAVLEELISSHWTNPDSLAGVLRLVRAALKRNMVIDSTTFDANNFMTAARIRFFDTAVAASTATDGGSGEGEFTTLSVTGTPESGTNLLKIGKTVKS